MGVSSTESGTDIRAKWLIYALPWIFLGLILVAWISVAEKRIERTLAAAERGEVSPKVEKVMDALRRNLSQEYVLIFTYGKPVPLPNSYIRRAWESTWRPRLRASLVLGGAIVCLTCNLLLAVRRRGDLDEEARSRRAWTGVAVVLGGGATLLLVLLGMPLATRTVCSADDFFNFHLPLRKFIADSWGRGDTASWCPLLSCGLDLHGEGQTGQDHPWHQLLYRALPVDVAINLEMLGGHVFALAGMTLLLRRWGLGLGPSLFGAFTFAFGSIFRKYFHVNAVGVISHIPWLLLCIDVLAGAPGRRTAVLARGAIALLTASQLLLGYPQWVWISLVFEGIYLLTCAASSGRPVGLLTDYVTAKTVGLMLGAAQLLPTFDVLSGSTRMERDPTRLLQIATTGSLHPLNFLLLVCPYAFTNRGYVPSVLSDSVASLYTWPKPGPDDVLGQNFTEFSHYAGVAPVILLLALLAWPRVPFRARSSGARLYVFGGVLIALGAILCLGRFSPLYPALARLPVINIFRCPARYMALSTFGLAILSSFALERLGTTGEGRPKSIRSLFLPAALLLAANLAVLALKLGFVPDADGELTSDLPYWPVVALNPILGLSILGLFALALRGSRVALLLLAVGHVADLSFYDLAHLWRIEPSNQTMAELCKTDEIPGRWYRGRIDVEWGGNNPYILRGLQVEDAYLGLNARKDLDYETTEARRVAGVGWSLPTAVIAEAEPIPGALAEVRLVPHARLSKDPRGDLAKIDLETTALVDVPVVIDDRGEATPGEARILSRSNAEYRVKTRTDSAQLLVVSSSYHKGWKAKIDGEPATVVRANGDFLGCVVPAGEHEIHLAWESASHRAGLAGSAAGLVLLAISLALPAGLIPRRDRVRPGA